VSATGAAVEPTERDHTTTGDSLTVAVWTLVSRVTGVVKIAVIGAVLGPTFFGNAYQFTNSLPNLLYFGLLAGSLFSSLLVPALVDHVDRGDHAQAARISGGFLGVTLVAMVALVPLAVALGPAALRLAAGSGDGAPPAAQAEVGRYLVLMFLPQLFLYAVVGTASAVMNARRRFALAAAAPAVENVGTIAVLATCAVVFGTSTDVRNVPTGELLLLGLGTTGAVALHAATQWWGARRVGVVLKPRAGWRDPEVRVVVRRALPSMAQAGLMALQVLSLLIIANRVAGGVVAFQIALNFYFLAIALGATPVALSLLPRLARLHADGATDRFRQTLVEGRSLGLFLAIPAAAAYAALSLPLARAVAFGRMDTGTGVTLMAGALAALALAVVGQTAFLIATYACYARKDTRSPLRSMVVQAVTCGALECVALRLHGTAVLVALGLAYAVSIAVAGLHLSLQLRRDLGGSGRRAGASVVRTAVGAAVMVGPAWLVATHVTGVIGQPLGSRLAVLAAALTGVVIFVAVQALLRTPELAWLNSGVTNLLGRARRTPVRAADG
jgi:putative peptidoglycan lipid II flippase